MKRPDMLLSVVVEEILQQHSLPYGKDVDYINRRLLEEGVSFLSITLPTFAASIELAIERGFLSRSDFPSFKAASRSRPYPAFLQGLVRKIFHDDGSLRDQFDPDAFFGIRQICYWLKKPKAECSPRRIAKAITSFWSTEEELSKVSLNHLGDSFDRICALLYAGDIFGDIDESDLMCKHGPGATAERLTLGARRSITTWTERLEDVLPSEHHVIPNFGWHDHLDQVNFLALTQEPPVRVVFVPKTMKAPRVIAIEPSHMQYAQQGILSYVVPKLERHPLTRNSVRFSDQSLNKRDAERASVTRREATLDLSEASDRVSLALVERVFKRSPLLPFLLASRSMHASTDGGKTSYFLRKFASMGSAMCFPVEAMVFYALIQHAHHVHYRRNPSARSVIEYSRRIAVYGDDLVIPVELRGIVQTVLESVGLKVNKQKSFSKGFFRESCGGDYYRGYDVTPVYLRHFLPANLDQCTPDVLMSLCETSNLLYKRGMWRSAQKLRDIVESCAKVKIPTSAYAGEGLVFFSYRWTTRCRWSQNHQGYVQKRIVFTPKQRVDPTHDVGLLMEVLRPVRRPASLLGGRSTGFDRESTVKRGCFKAKTRWIHATIGMRA